MGRTLVFDLETDGLLPDLTKAHCIGAIDVDTEEEFAFRPHEIDEGLRFLSSAGLLIGHNAVGFDVPALRKLYGGDSLVLPPVRDTMLMAKLAWPADVLVEADMRRKNAGLLPGHLVKRHSLEAWGWRLGERKGDYGKTSNWDTFSEDMLSYMMQDCRVTLRLWRLVRERMGDLWSERAIDTEHACAAIVARQETTGFSFDRGGAIALASRLKNEQAALGAKLSEAFGGWWQRLSPQAGEPIASTRKAKLSEHPEVVIRRFSEKTGKELAPYKGPPLCEYVAGDLHCRIEWVEFNPHSRQHLANRLSALYGWKPTAFGGKDGTQPILDEGTIKAIPRDVLPDDLKDVILAHFVASKTLAQLAEGKRSWLGYAGAEDPRIRGRCDTVAAVTHRGTHGEPNLAQVPSVSKAKDGAILMGRAGGYGYECRSLFRASPGLELTGTDASGLELRTLGHYLHPLDGGAFAARVSTPGLDIHTAHAAITGLDRAATKTVTYMKIYGGGALKVGHAVGVADEEVDGLVSSDEANSYLKFIARTGQPRPERRDLAAIVKGRRVIAAFEKGIVGLKDLAANVTEVGKSRGFVRGIDGRKVYVRKAHAALNTLLQNAGAVICKMWMVRLHEKLRAEGLRPGQDYEQVVWVHDELQIEHREGLGDVIGRASRAAIREAGEALNFRGTLEADYKTGRTWADTH